MNALERLSQILNILRKQCPWDSVQTMESLRYLTIEEVNELSDAILNLYEIKHRQTEPTVSTGHDAAPTVFSAAETHANDELKKELGDLFMHLVFYSKIAEEEHRFSLDDVLHAICDKLQHRHPHIALPDHDGHLQGGSQREAPAWEQIKMKEGRQSVLEGVPSSLPTLLKTIRIQEKAMGAGFRFTDSNEARNKVAEETDELNAAISHNDKQAIEEEFGDLLFALICWSHYLGVNADDALSLTNRKFQRRFHHIEQWAHQQGKTISELTPIEMQKAWQDAKICN